MKAIITILFAVCLVSINSSYSQWEWQSPLPQGNLLYKVQFVNSSVGWAAGEYGTLFHTTDGGLHWTEQEYGRTDNLLALSMFSQFTGWSGGDNGTILHTTNGGDDWLEQTSGTGDGINALFFLDSLNGWAAGDRELILHTTNGGATWGFQRQAMSQLSINTITFISATEGWAAGAGRRVYHTTDGGTTWNYQTLGPSGTSHLHVYFADASLGFIVGTGGSVLRTDNGGATWSEISTDNTINYNQIVMQNNFVGWIAGDGGRILRTLNGGASWSTTILSDGTDLNGISRYGGTGTLWMVGETGRILRSTNNGVSWSSLDSGSRLSVNWIDFSSAANGFAVGQTGLILHTSDGGMSWTERASPAPSTSMFGVDMVGDLNGWAVGDEATILHTSDGMTWSVQPNPAAGYILFGAAFPDAQNGWVSGGEFLENRGIILHTTNSGGSWNIQLNTSSVVFGINFTDDLSGWAVGGSGAVLHTTNGGIDWIPQTSTVTTALYWSSFSDPLIGWIVGDGGTILHTTNGGSVWTKQNSGVSANLYSIAVEGSLRATIAGNSGTILRTTDGGTTWQKEYSRTAIDLFGVAHSGNTWVCGDYGAILTYKEPTVYGSVTGRIVNDLNNNGAPDVGEPGIGGWEVQITGPETLTTYSSADGSFTFSQVKLGTYNLTQSVVPGWSQTMPVAPAWYSFTLNESGTGFSGNFCNHTLQSSAFDMQGGWNLLSCPVRLDDPRIASIFPAAQSNAFYYAEGYMVSDSVPEALGYWMKFPENTTQWIAGSPIPIDTIPIRAGWNIVGSVSVSTDTSAIISEPPEIIVSDYYGYNQSYYIAGSIEPGKGYWAKASQNGSLILNGGTGKSAALKNSNTERKMRLNSLTVTDASGKSGTLFFGLDRSCPVDPLRYELPPLPPDGCFDVRFKKGGSVCLFSKISNSAPIGLQSVQYPLKIEWYIDLSDQTRYQIVDIPKGNKIVPQLSGSGSISLESGDPSRLALSASGIAESGNIPSEFALMQNSPNPFNPSTTIRFMLPRKSHVILEIFSSIGQRIGTLTDEVRDAGAYAIGWSPDIAGGIYFCRLEATPVDKPGEHFVSAKKMVLLK